MKGTGNKNKSQTTNNLKQISEHFMKLSLCNSINNFKSIYKKKKKNSQKAIK